MAFILGEEIISFFSDGKYQMKSQNSIPSKLTNRKSQYGFFSTTFDSGLEFQETWRFVIEKKLSLT